MSKNIRVRHTLCKCDKCENTFSEADIIEISDRHEVFGFPCYETVGVSPCCRYSFSIGEDCPICGGYMEEGKDCCGTCIDRLKKKFFEWYETLSDDEIIGVPDMLIGLLENSEVGM